ncbi:putative bifunctional diguanylate cyclase/phosphodiesterase [Sphingomonas solaris]|uniref:Bifunctional diguanylate cyclase/phosphodiesterase n=1 Tax=Alterirhizorhabdus solaris TaxID=2529389 RepID=A0A558RD16_9SPHN|nr:bifunctional diguanylate cyclase/phosphodiesterase [Sphingomonas solaris]TVV77258.1 bifunctional diguanylate cyclase/phosphodiesterase [Sphingomonas solaris]
MVLALALGGILAIALAGISMNRDAVRNQTQLVDNALSQGVVDALNGVQTVAFWDNTVRKLQARPLDKAWLDYEIGEYLTQVYGHSAVWILDPANRPVYAYTPGDAAHAARLGEFTSDLDELVAVVRGGREDGRRMRNASFRSNQSRYAQNSLGSRGNWTAHIVANRGQAVILSVMTIVPSTNQVTIQGRPFLIVTAVRIGASQLRGFADSLLIPDLRAVPLSAPPRLSGRYIVTSDRGVPIERYEWTARVPGAMLLHYVLPLFVVVTLIAGLLLLVTLRRMQTISVSLVDKEKEASFLTNYDPLSSLPNRRLFSQKLDAALATPENTTLAFCDLDNFKTINDTLGHELGDLLIQIVARRLRESFPECVVVARFGGDEFALMHSERWLSVEEFGARIQQAFAEPVDLGGTPTRIGISVGIVTAPEHGRDATDLMRNADIALYQAKDAGRARCAIYHRGMRDLIFVRKEREARIVQMLESERFELHYQPIVDIRTACVSGMEALLRWPSDDPMPMSPAEFIPIAESAGLMVQLGDWIIRRAFADSLRWPKLWISINLSPLQIKAPDLLDQLERHLRATGADPRRIMFEITEGLLLDSTSRTRQTLHGIRAMGFRMGLDDFGTGYSSLSYLQEFTFDKLKIDRSFICDGKLEEPRSASLVKAVIDVGRALGIEVVAEGVEHIKEAVILKMLGCDQIQGWLYGRALPPARATEHLAALTETLRDPPETGPAPTLRLLSS